MDCVCPVNEVEQQLKEAGEQLSLPPSSTKDLLDLLDKTEQLLTFVGQAPSISMQGALVPSMGALIADELIRHTDVDVKVSVASCLCEVARITAPEPPYKDEIMKEIFQLNVMAFGELSNVTGHSYCKAIHVLESVAKVKSCLLMLDLECDALILGMFELFLSTIRTNHPCTVFSDMEAIMTLVIEESDEITSELLSLLISHVKKENQNVSPASWQLAEKVLKKCYDTLKPYSQTVMKLINSDPDDYAEVVTSLCRNAYGNELMGTTSGMTDGINKRDDNTLENGGSPKTLMHSPPKKQTYIDTQRVAAVPKKIENKSGPISKLGEGYNRNRLKGKELEESQNISSSAKARLKNKKNNSAGFSLEKKSTNGKPEKGMSKTKGVAKGSMKTSGALYNVVIKQEDEVLSDSGGGTHLFSQATDKTGSRRKPSSKKHDAEGSRKKDFKDAYNLKQYGIELVGHRIKVWWPLDRMYYEGAVYSYFPSSKKHKVLYADGDEEILDLRDEKWQILDDMSPNQEQVADLPSRTTTSVNRKAKRKTESSLKQEGNSCSPKRQAPVHLLKTEPSKEHDAIGADGSTTGTLCNVDIQENPVPVRRPKICCGLKAIGKHDMQQDGDPNPSAEFDETETRTGKKRPRLVKSKS